MLESNGEGSRKELDLSGHLCLRDALLSMPAATLLVTVATHLDSMRFYFSAGIGLRVRVDC